MIHIDTHGNYRFDTIANAITDQLRSDIINGVYKDGEHIGLVEMAKKFGVSYMPVREALQCLKGEGLVELLQYKGARVRSVNPNEVGYIYDIRMAMEALITAEVITRPYPEGFLEELERLNKQTDFSLSPQALSVQFQKTNNDFHYYLFTLSKNTRAKDLYVLYSNLFRTLKGRYMNTPAEIKRSTDEHALMIQTLADRDAGKMKDIVVAHATHAKEALLQKLKEG